MATMYSLFLYRIPDQSELYGESCIHNTSKSDAYRRHCKKYTLHISYYGGAIDLPPELDVNPLPNLGKYSYLPNIREGSQLIKGEGGNFVKI